jgi:lysozyme family protein
MPQYTFERLRPEYEALWERMQVKPDCAATIEHTAR